MKPDEKPAATRKKGTTSKPRTKKPHVAPIPPASNDNISRRIGGLVPAALRGSDRFLDIVNWNIKYFTSGDPRRVRLVTLLMEEINADLFVLQEIEHGSLDGVVQALRDAHAGSYKVHYGATGGDQRIAFVYDTEWVKSKQDITDIFKEHNDATPGRKKPFPRLPLYSQFTGRTSGKAFDFHLMGVHLKSQRVAQGATDAGDAQREAAAVRLARWMKAELDDEQDAIVMGDFNAPPDRKEWEALRELERTDKARFVSWNDKKEGSHFYKSGRNSRLDLVLVSKDADGNAVDKKAHVINWNDAFPKTDLFNDIVTYISDHRPVISRFYFDERNDD